MAQDSDDNKPKKKLSQFGDYDDGVMSLKGWEDRWQKGQTRFHMEEAHPSLVKHVDKLTLGKENLRFFLPLCGKSVDLRWLADRGHDVVGCEGVEMGCQQFYEENSMEYTTETLQDPPGKVFKSKDPSKRVTLYCCDFFKLTKDVIGQFDCIWDRGSLAAINKDDREKYTKVVTGLLSAHTRYLADVFKLDNTNFSGPPHNFPPEEMTLLFSGKCNIEQIDETDAMTPWQVEWGIDSFLACDYMITLR